MIRKKWRFIHPRKHLPLRFCQREIWFSMGEWKQNNAFLLFLFFKLSFRFLSKTTHSPFANITSLLRKFHVFSAKLRNLYHNVRINTSLCLIRSLLWIFPLIHWHWSFVLVIRNWTNCLYKILKFNLADLTFIFDAVQR